MSLLSSLPHVTNDLDRHIQQTNERLLCIKQHLTSPASFQAAARELLEWCSDARAYQRTFEGSLLDCIATVSQVSLQPGFDLELGYRLVAVCSVHKEHFTAKASAVLTQWSEELGRQLLVRHQKLQQRVADANDDCSSAGGSRNSAAGREGVAAAAPGASLLQPQPASHMIQKAYPVISASPDAPLAWQAASASLGPGQAHHQQQQPHLSVVTTVWGVTQGSQSAPHMAQQQQQQQQQQQMAAMVAGYSGNGAMSHHTMNGGLTYMGTGAPAMQHPAAMASHQMHGLTRQHSYPGALPHGQAPMMPSTPDGLYRQSSVNNSGSYMSAGGMPGQGHIGLGGPQHNPDYQPPAGALSAAALVAAAATATATATATASMVLQEQQQQRHQQQTTPPPHHASGGPYSSMPTQMHHYASGPYGSSSAVATATSGAMGRHVPAGQHMYLAGPNGQMSGVTQGMMVGGSMASTMAMQPPSQHQQRVPDMHMALAGQPMPTAAGHALSAGQAAGIAQLRHQPADAQGQAAYQTRRPSPYPQPHSGLVQKRHAQHYPNFDTASAPAGATAASAAAAAAAAAAASAAGGYSYTATAGGLQYQGSAPSAQSSAQAMSMRQQQQQYQVAAFHQSMSSVVPGSVLPTSMAPDGSPAGLMPPSASLQSSAAGPAAAGPAAAGYLGPQRVPSYGPAPQHPGAGFPSSVPTVNGMRQQYYGASPSSMQLGYQGSSVGRYDMSGQPMSPTVAANQYYMPHDVKPDMKHSAGLQQPQDEVRLTFPLREGIILPPFRLEHNLVVSNHAFLLKDSVYQALMQRSELELQLKSFHQEDRVMMSTNWPPSVSISINSHPMVIERGGGVGGGDSKYHQPLYIKDACLPGRNTIQISVAVCSCSHLFVLQLVQRPTVRSVVHGLLKKRLLPAESCIAKIKRNFANPSADGSSAHTSADHDGIEQTLVKMSLKCPITFRRITLPARGADCRHVQCFDLESYVLLNAKRFNWRCPVCSKDTPLEFLEIDQYIWTILQKLQNTGVEDVSIDASAQWKEVRTNIKDEDSSNADMCGGPNLSCWKVYSPAGGTSMSSAGSYEAAAGGHAMPNPVSPYPTPPNSHSSSQGGIAPSYNPTSIYDSNFHSPEFAGGMSGPASNISDHSLAAPLSNISDGAMDVTAPSNDVVPVAPSKKRCKSRSNSNAAACLPPQSSSRQSHAAAPASDDVGRAATARRKSASCSPKQAQPPAASCVGAATALPAVAASAHSSAPVPQPTHNGSAVKAATCDSGDICTDINELMNGSAEESGGMEGDVLDNIDDIDLLSYLGPSETSGSAQLPDDELLALFGQ